MTVWDELKSTFSALFDTAEASAKKLPDGGTPDHPDPSRLDDEAYITDLANLAAYRCKRDRTDDQFAALERYFADLLHKQAEVLYNHGVDSLVAATRRACQFGVSETGTCKDVFAYVLNTIDGWRPEILDNIQQSIVDAITGLPSLGLGDPDDGLIDILDTTPARMAIRDLIPNSFVTGARVWHDLNEVPKDPVINTSYIGQVAHSVIQAHYCMTHPGHELLIDSWLLQLNNNVTNVLDIFPSTLDSMLLKGSTADIAETLRKGLLGNTAGTFKQPDILDVDERQVYEIKPAKSIGRGLVQVFGYLLTLNTHILQNASAAESLLKNQTTAGGFNNTGNGNVFLPGYAWQPSPFYEVPLSTTETLVIIAARPVPGIIVYNTYVARTPKGQSIGSVLGVCTVALGLVALTVLLAPEVAVAAVAIAAEDAAIGTGAEVITLYPGVAKAAAAATSVVSLKAAAATRQH